MKTVFWLFLIVIFISTGLLATAGFLSPKKVYAQTEPKIEYVTGILTTVTDIEFLDNYAFITNAGNLSVYNFTDIEHPFFVSNYKPDDCNFTLLDVLGNTLFSMQASGDLRLNCYRNGIRLANSFHIFDISNKQSLSELGSVNITGPGGASEVEQSASYSFVTNSHGGFVAIDVTNPVDPQIVNTFEGGNAIFVDVNVIGQTAYLADLYGKLWIVDIHDPLNMNILSNDLSIPNALKVDISGNYAYVAASGDGLFIVDVRNPVNPEVVGQINWKDEIPSDNNTLDVAVSGGFAFLSNSYRGVVVVDISDPENPVEVDRYSYGGLAQRIKVKDGYVFALDLEQGLKILKFGDVEEEEVGTVLDVPMFKQTDPEWKDNIYADADKNNLGCGSTIGECGCALSSIAMILKYHGVDRDPDGNPTTPETVNNYFKREEKCDERGCTSWGYAFGSVLWSVAGNYSAETHSNFNTQKIVFKGEGNVNVASMGFEIENSRPVVMKMRGNEHWVVGKSVSNTTIGINDPGYERKSLNDPAYENVILASRLFEKTASDFSSFEVVSKAPTQLLVTDNHGRRTGFDVSTNSVVEEIPNSYYEFEGAYSDPAKDGTPTGDGVYVVDIGTPEQSVYKVQVIGVGGSDYGFSVHASDKDAGIDLNIFGGNLPQNGSVEYKFDYSPDPSKAEKFAQEIKIDIWPFVKKNIIFSKLKLPTPVGILSSPTFNAPKDLDRKSITFGKTGDEKSLVECLDFNPDLNHDGRKDLYCLFSTQKSNFILGTPLGILKAKTKNDLSVVGTDKVFVYNRN